MVVAGFHARHASGETRATVACSGGDVSFTNEQLARCFGEIAALLKLSGEDAFRVRAYERAAGAIAAAQPDLAAASDADIAGIRGIGASTVKKIREFLDTGGIAMLDELRAAVPPGIVELTRVPGLGPKTARQLHDELGIESVEALRAAIDGGRLRDLPGIGSKTAANLRAAIDRMGAKDVHRVPAADALAVAEELCALLGAVPGVERVAYAGSLRRMRETIGDIDVVAAAPEAQPVMDAFRRAAVVESVIAAGDKRSSVITVRGIQADLRVVDPDVWGAALVYFTGSQSHNIRIRERAVRRGLMLNEYGLHRRHDHGGLELLASRDEAGVYRALGMQHVAPPMREDTGEVEAAADGSLPDVVTLEDIRGDLHGHSEWSGDGKATLAEMVAAAAERGYDYWAVTDHAENLTMNGVDRARMLQRRRVIESLQERHQLRILDGVELNIGIDGTLDYDREFLLQFDFCVASVHTLMQRGRGEQTQRIIAAMEHPAVHVIGHPTGRLIGRRPGYDVDLDALVDAAVRTGTALEVNASPRRLDMSGAMVRRAVGAGAAVTISSDAHSIGDLANMRFGVRTAQRGWATPADVLNCRDVEGLLEFVQAKRS